jgi:beta-glucuronidase
MNRIIAIIFLVCSAMTVMASDIKDIALYPVQNEFRNKMSLDGIWEFRCDSTDCGEHQAWYSGLAESKPIAVPGSWNEQIEGLRNYLGPVWYQKRVVIPSSWSSRRLMIRVGSAVYSAKLWVNGQEVGSHEGGNTPFAFEINRYVKWGQENLISIRVENELRLWRVPSGGGKVSSTRSFPKTNFDFFPYSGIHRSVLICTEPRESALTDVWVKTNYDGSTGEVNALLTTRGKAQQAVVKLLDDGKVVAQQRTNVKDGEAEANLKVSQVKLWSPEHPHLYQLVVELTEGGKVVDKYSLRTGVRTIKVEGSKILLNGQQLKLRGFGKHEDFPIFGRGVAMPVEVRDMELMKWVGANSFRTSHYPYDESVYDLADQLGFIIIDEIPGVGLNFYDEYVDQRQEQCKNFLKEMITRDKNHPSVCFWSVCNEPTPQRQTRQLAGNVDQQVTDEDRKAIDCLTELVNTAKQLDPTRLVSFACAMGTPDSWMKPVDVLFLNRYYGWYTHQGEWQKALIALDGEMQRLYSNYHKPIVYTEFGADCIAGFHSTDEEFFSEEFQCKFVNDYLNVANTHDYVAGMMLWAFADFRTGQSIIRVKGQNLKGAFTMDRKPKAVAHLLKRRWAGKNY